MIINQIVAKIIVFTTIVIMSWFVDKAVMTALNNGTLIDEESVEYGVPNEPKLFCVGCSIITPSDILYPTSNIYYIRHHIYYIRHPISYQTSDIVYPTSLTGGGSPP